MITKEHEIKKYCCFYASEYHLEMILLPYIKNNIDKTKFVILTEDNLSESMKTLLDRTNLDTNEKNKILALDWNCKEFEEFSNYDFNKSTIIINGSNNYIEKVNEKIEKMAIQKGNIIDCYNINEKSLKVMKIQEKYDDILNTQNL
jgi:hypothetical protein